MADGNIFISYRRGADSNAAGRLYDRLERQFNRERLFFDIDSIPLGVDFAEHIDGEVAKCDVQLVVIGPGWVDEVDRLHDPDDFVRIEIEAALVRPDIPLIPVLCEGAEMPGRETLPDSLHALTRRNAIEVSHAQFAQTVDGRLLQALRSMLQAHVAQEPDMPSGGDRADKAQPERQMRAVLEDGMRPPTDPRQGGGGRSACAISHASDTWDRGTARTVDSHHVGPGGGGSGGDRLEPLDGSDRTCFARK